MSAATLPCSFKKGKCIHCGDENEGECLGWNPAPPSTESLMLLIKAVHRAKGRYHSQQAMCDLYDACGLSNTRPEQRK